MRHSLLIAGICFVAFANDAWGTCGDYLIMPDHDGLKSTATVSTLEDILSGSAALAVDEIYFQVQGGNGHQRPASPCRGPGCRGDAPIESPQAPVSLKRQADEAFSADVKPPQSPDSRWLPASSVIIASTGERDPLERPPQHLVCR